MVGSLTAVARRLNFIRETEGPNRGAWVSMLQRFCFGNEGDSWCADFASFVLDVAYHGKPPIRRSGSAEALLDASTMVGQVVRAPQPDDLFFFVDATGHAHHVGFVTGTAPLTAIAGNTSPDGMSDNGTGVFEHPISADPARVVFVRLPM